MDFCLWPKLLVSHATKVAKNLSNNYGQKLLDSAKKSTTLFFHLALLFPFLSLLDFLFNLFLVHQNLLMLFLLFFL